MRSPFCLYPLSSRFAYHFAYSFPPSKITESRRPALQRMRQNTKAGFVSHEGRPGFFVAAKLERASPRMYNPTRTPSNSKELTFTKRHKIALT